MLIPLPPVPYNYQIVGTCSMCGGPVVLPMVWHSVVPPVPTCMDCGAIKKRSHGPTIDMERRPPFHRGIHRDFFDD